MFILSSSSAFRSTEWWAFPETRTLPRPVKSELRQMKKEMLGPLVVSGRAPGGPHLTLTDYINSAWRVDPALGLAAMTVLWDRPGNEVSTHSAQLGIFITFSFLVRML